MATIRRATLMRGVAPLDQQVTNQLMLTEIRKALLAPEGFGGRHFMQVNACHRRLRPANYRPRVTPGCRLHSKLIGGAAHRIAARRAAQA